MKKTVPESRASKLFAISFHIAKLFVLPLLIKFPQNGVRSPNVIQIVTLPRLNESSSQVHHLDIRLHDVLASSFNCHIRICPLLKPPTHYNRHLKTPSFLL